MKKEESHCKRAAIAFSLIISHQSHSEFIEQ